LGGKQHTNKKPRYLVHAAELANAGAREAKVAADVLHGAGLGLAVRDFAVDRAVQLNQVFDLYGSDCSCGQNLIVANFTITQC
jgi:hypothetical protein